MPSGKSLTRKSLELLLPALRKGTKLKLSLANAPFAQMAEDAYGRGLDPHRGLRCHEPKLLGDFEVGGFRAPGCNLFRRLLMLLSCLVSRSTCGPVAMTSAPHPESRQLDPGQVHDFSKA